MAATWAVPDKRIVLERVGWETYERLLAEHVNSLGTRCAYHGENLEIVVGYKGHEDLNRTLAQLVEAVAMEADLLYCRTGSTTFKRDDLHKGFEPDSSFYIEHAEEVRSKDKIDLHHDPPPDLVIEIDITSDSLDRFPIFAGVGVPEVWRCSEGRVLMYRLRENGYVPLNRSVAAPPMTPEMATRSLELSSELTPKQWFLRVQTWVREQLRQ